jgi:hypothetical protein
MVVSETFAMATMILDLYRMKVVLLFILTFFILIYILIHYNPHIQHSIGVSTKENLKCLMFMKSLFQLDMTFTVEKNGELND